MLILPIISLPIYCFSSAYFSFQVLFCFIIPWLQWLPLLWGMYTCSACFPTQKSQKHSGLFCLGRLITQTYNLFYFYFKPCVQIKIKQTNKQNTKEPHKPTGCAPSKIYWLNFWAPFWVQWVRVSRIRFCLLTPLSEGPAVLAEELAYHD